MKNLFLIALTLVLAAVVVNEIYPELGLAARIRTRLTINRLGPQPEPPDMPYTDEGMLHVLE